MRGIYPGPILAALAGLPVALSLGVFLSPLFLPLVLGIDGAIVLVALVDLLSLPRPGRIAVSRRSGRVASLGRRHAVTLRLENNSHREAELLVRDDVPSVMEADPEEMALRLPPGAAVEVEYSVRPRERGSWTLQKVHGRARSRLGFWMRQLSWPAETIISVYPDLKQLGRYTLLARIQHLSLLGVRSVRRVGEDSEFESLRDHNPDDPYSRIDWRATARRRRLTVREYQATRSQRVIFLVDCGRMMMGHHDGVGLLDRALDAVLMLSWVAIGRGDAVGLLTYSDRILGWLPPAGGRRQMDRIIREAHDRFPEMVESRHDDAFRLLDLRARKRSLVVLLTQVLDEANASALEHRLRVLTGRHLPMAVLLRDPALDRTLAGAGAGADRAGLFPGAAAAGILLWRQRVIRTLERAGTLVLDAPPAELTPSLINEYLRIKARHLL